MNQQPWPTITTFQSWSAESSNGSTSKTLEQIHIHHQQIDTHNQICRGTTKYVEADCVIYIYIQRESQIDRTKNLEADCLIHKSQIDTTKYVEANCVIYIESQIHKTPKYSRGRKVCETKKNLGFLIQAQARSVQMKSWPLIIKKES